MGNSQCAPAAPGAPRTSLDLQSAPGGAGGEEEHEAQRRSGASCRRRQARDLPSASLCVFLCGLFFTSPIRVLSADTQCFPCV